MRRYYADENVTLYLGDMRDVVPQLDGVDAVVTDPPYGETRLGWDSWPDGWPTIAATAARSMWCFGSTRMFLQNAGQFDSWKFSQDVVWEKHNGSGFAADRFRRVHENATHWYRGSWGDIHHEVPIVAHDGPHRGTRRAARGRSARGLRRMRGLRPGPAGRAGYRDNRKGELTVPNALLPPAAALTAAVELDRPSCGCCGRRSAPPGDGVCCGITTPTHDLASATTVIARSAVPA